MKIFKKNYTEKVIAEITLALKIYRFVFKSILVKNKLFLTAKPLNDKLCQFYFLWRIIIKNKFILFN